MAQQRQGPIESNWENLKDKVKASLDKVVEAVGSYPATPDDLAPIADIAAAPRKRVAADMRLRKAAQPASKAKPVARAAGARGRPATVSKRALATAGKKGMRGIIVRAPRKSA